MTKYILISTNRMFAIGPFNSYCEAESYKNNSDVKDLVEIVELMEPLK